MSKRHPNPRLVKIHRSYTVEEIARLCGVHRNTVREWIKRGLRTCDSRRPLLVLANDLIAFLKAKRERNKRSCGPGQMYCMRCRSPRTPAGDMADYLPVSPSQGNLVGMCPVCESMMYRRVNPAKLSLIRGPLDVALPQAWRHIADSAGPFDNSDFAKESRQDVDAQP